MCTFCMCRMCACVLYVVYVFMYVVLCMLCVHCMYMYIFCCTFIVYVGVYVLHVCECLCAYVSFPFFFFQIYIQEVKEKMCHNLWRIQPQIKQIKNNLPQVVRKNVEGLSKKERNLLGNPVYICIACFRVKTKKPKHIHAIHS